MDDLEFLKLNKSQVRSDKALLDIFVEKFSREFGYTPSCTPCTLNKDFERLKNRLRMPLKIEKDMTDNSNKTHIPLSKEIIRVNGKAIWTTNATDEQVIAYITDKAGDSEARKKRWKVLPTAMTEEKVVEKEVKPTAKKKRRKTSKDAK